MSSGIPAGTRLLGPHHQERHRDRRSLDRVRLGGRVRPRCATASRRSSTRSPSSRRSSRSVFQIEGETVTVFGGEGIVLDGPQARADYYDQLPRCSSIGPHTAPRSATRAASPATPMSSRRRSSSRSSTPAGKTLVDQQVMATCGTGCRGTFDVFAAVHGHQGPVGHAPGLQPLGEGRDARGHPRVPRLADPGELTCGDPGGQVPVRPSCAIIRRPCKRAPSVGAWRSLVARIVRDDEVGGSNPLAPTKAPLCPGMMFSGVVSCAPPASRCGRDARSAIEGCPDDLSLVVDELCFRPRRQSQRRRPSDQRIASPPRSLVPRLRARASGPPSRRRPPVVGVAAAGRLALVNGLGRSRVWHLRHGPRARGRRRVIGAGPNGRVASPRTERPSLPPHGPLHRRAVSSTSVYSNLRGTASGGPASLGHSR